MMRKAQDRAGLHGGIGAMQGMKGMAGFGSTLASNKFVRAAVREEVREKKIDPMTVSCALSLSLVALVTVVALPLQATMIVMRVLKRAIAKKRLTYITSPSAFGHASHVD